MAEYGDNWDCNPANAVDCPACKGKGCKECNDSGEVTPSTYRSIIKDSKEYEKDCD